MLGHLGFGWCIAQDLALDPPMTRVASIGECMIELSQAGNGLLQRGWGGDTLNTAVYLARLGVAVDYVTALGDDPLERRDGGGLARPRAWAPAAWCACPAACPASISSARTPPDSAASTTGATARRRGCCSTCPRRGEIVAALAGYDLVYLSGISLSLYGEAGRERLLAALDGDPRRRRRASPSTPTSAPALWPDRALARAAFRAALRRADIVLASTEDLDQLFGERRPRGAADAATGASRSCSSSPSRRCASSIAGAELTVAAPPVAQRRRHHGRRRQLRRGLPGGAARGRRVGDGGALRPHASPAPSCSTAAPSFRARRCPNGCRVATQQGSRRAPGEPHDRNQRARRPASAARGSTRFCAPRRSFPSSPSSARTTACRWRGRWWPAACSALEITLRTPAAPAAARAIGKAVPEAIVGIGTVLTPQDLETARGLGARFAVSPGATPELLDAAAGERAAVRSGRADRLRADGGAGARLRRGEVLPGGARGRHRRAEGAGRPVPAGAVLPHGRHRRGEFRRLADAAQRRLRRRLLARARRRHPRRQLARHHGAGAAGGGEVRQLGRSAIGRSRSARVAATRGLATSGRETEHSRGRRQSISQSHSMAECREPGHR